ncbi:helix-turn-helix domain-containing protein [Streptomyces zhihengii]|uniref:helix-turn-helix domain-containing protein n=1 Tax=Streptomyces zhihengii TaxID=1818004 RepID=UPI003452AD4E
MSVEALNYSRRVKVGNTTAKFVLNRLADRADERFSCYPSVPLIAAEIEVGERSVQRALALLRELRLVSDRPQYRADGSQTTSRYTLHGPWDDYAGTGVPFPEIVTPKQARAELWAQAPAEAPFRAGTAAAVALSGDADEAKAAAQRAFTAAAKTVAVKESKQARGRKAAAAKLPTRKSTEAVNDVSAGEEGVTSMSPPPATSVSPPPATLASPLEPTSTTPTTEALAPSARSAGDVRRTGAGSSSCAKKSGSAATAKPSSSGERQGANVPLQRYKEADSQATACRAVEAGLPAALVALLPYGHIPKRNRAAVLDALDSRTPAQLADRAARRWLAYRYEVALHDGELRAPIGVALELIGPTPYCPNVDCEDGIQDGHVGGRVECTMCVIRRRERRIARLKGLPVLTARTAGSRARAHECVDCGRPFPGPVPEGSVCIRCTEEAAAACQSAAAQWTTEAADQEQQAAEARLQAAAELARLEAEEKRKGDAKAADAEARRVADAEETERLREQVAREHPELAVYAVQQAARVQPAGTAGTVRAARG